MERQHAPDDQARAGLQQDLALLRAGGRGQVDRLALGRLCAAVGAEAHLQAVLNRVAHQGRGQPDALLDHRAVRLVRLVPLGLARDDVEQDDEAACRGEVVLLDLEPARARGGAPVDVPRQVPGAVVPDSAVEEEVRVDEAAHDGLALPARCGQANLLAGEQARVDHQRAVHGPLHRALAHAQQVAHRHGIGGERIVPPVHGAHLVRAPDALPRAQEEHGAVVALAADLQVLLPAEEELGRPCASRCAARAPAGCAGSQSSRSSPGSRPQRRAPW